MSAPKIRQKMGPIRKRLEDKVTESKVTLRELIEDKQLNDDNKSKLRTMSNALDRYSQTLAENMKDWESAKLGDKTEEDLYDQSYNDLTELLMNSVDLYNELENEYENFCANSAQSRQQEVAKIAAATPIPTTENVTKTPRTRIKLPNIELKKFSGGILEWFTFIEQYNPVIHENPDLENISKFNYLLTKLEGEPADLLKGLRTTAANYSVAISLLEEEYGDKQAAIDLHYVALTNIPPATHETNLRATMSEVETHLRSLEALNEDVKHAHFISLVKSKIPSSVLQQISLQKGSTPWTVQLLRDHVKKNLRARRESIQFGAHDISENISQMTVDGLVAPSYRRTTTFRPRCVYCLKEHYSDRCEEYMDCNSRKAKLGNACWLCLKNHIRAECPDVETQMCVHCNSIGKHHRSLCPKKFSGRTTGAHLAFQNDEDDELQAGDFSDDALPKSSTTAHTHSVVAFQNKKVMMQLAKTKIINPNTSKQENCLIMLDCGSGRSYITKRLAEKLKLKRICHEKLSVNTFGTDSHTQVSSPVVKTRILLKNGEFMNIMCNVVPVITGDLKQDKTPMKLPIKDEDLALSHDLSSDMLPLDILVGNDYYYDIVQEKKMEVSSGLYLIESKLGWILSGRMQNTDLDNNDNCELSLFSSISKQYMPNMDLPLNEKISIEDLWNLEKVGILENPMITDDEVALQKYHETVKFIKQRYFVTWPCKGDGFQDLPQNYGLCMGRLKSLVKILIEAGLLSDYDKLIHREEEREIVEKVDDNEDSSNEDIKIQYQPHQLVITPDKNTTKLRKVHDASAKSKKENPSLNDLLYRGPVILEDICALILRFRLNEVAIISDIEKAFHALGLQKQDRDVVRFLWLKDITKPVVKDNIQIYRFARVPFGVISSPFLLAATIQHHLNQTDSVTANTIKNNIYVDNVITGAKSEEEAKIFYEEAKELFSSASMNLREWVSNSETLMKFIPEADRGSVDNTKVLGIKWDVKLDCLEIVVPKIDDITQWTKRTILSVLARIPDLLGFFAPTILMGKILIQDLWISNHDWDDILSEEQEERWLKIWDSIKRIREVKIPRCIVTQNSAEFELLAFCDASARAMGAVIYLRTVDKNQKHLGTSLVFQKARLLPKKMLTIPQAEVSAAEMAAKCLQYVEKAIGLTISRKFMWTDSQCVLSWLESKLKLSRYVGNRIKTLRALTDVEFRFVAGEVNPADATSRGEDPVKLEMSGHFTGPEWLKNPCAEWPTWNKEPVSASTMDEIRRETVGPNTVSTSLVAGEGASGKSPTPFGIRLENYSNLTKLLRVTAWCNRFRKLISKKKEIIGPLTAAELEEAKTLWDFFVQHDVYKSEIDKLDHGTNCELVNQLGLKRDDNGVLRCHHRLKNADLDEDAIFPKLLPKNHHYTKLVILSYHEKLFHARTAHTLSQVRHQYWIPSGRRSVYSTILNCSLCKKYHSGSYSYPKFPQLPVASVTRSTPFCHTGLDYLGPLYIKSDNGTQKIWVCLFTCRAVRAVRLEAMMDMTPEEFLLGLRRFIARSKPDKITLDNASQFIVTQSTVDMAWNNVVQHEDVQSYISNVGITWDFIVPHAPWMGGFYERLVGVVKGALRKGIGRACLNRSQLETILVEAEAIVNSRPLVYVGEDLGDGVALTPAHFLNVSWKNGTPILEDNNDEDYHPQEPSSAEILLESWRKGQRYLNELWQVFYNDYLLRLRERTQTKLTQSRIQSRQLPKVDDIVLIKEDKMPRGSWKMGKIVDLVTSSDDQIRSAHVLLPNRYIIHRPINLLYPIETSIGADISNDNRRGLDGATAENLNSHLVDQDNRRVLNVNENRIVDDENNHPQNQANLRPTRAAARAARAFFKTLDE